jgi:hypothetical protein
MRIKEECKGNCGNCELLQSGQVDMVPCVLDQIFGRVQRMERRITELDSAKDYKIATYNEAPKKQ